ncbi:type IV secretory system conjugative DNA transfer family protein [Acidithrix ferrooxidans]|uniref:TraM recognition site of TraD and TraG n=1 Tax=Acidithrix ferrooxidans TaxID=1280514 RepID=A0A0D8HCV5_9ACTN|nr:TraM recognition domain-containing protein [Acidithrix ferrooxidans]KJF15805.1 TraM recognition site of TraD and TraG [Acidithrix ferrooxidans]
MSVRTDHKDDYTFAWVIALCLAAYFLFVGGGLLSALLSGNGFPIHSAPPLLNFISHLRNPSLAWGVPVGPRDLYWASTVFVFVVSIGGPWYLIARVKNRSRDRATDQDTLPGFASAREVKAIAGRKHLRATIRSSVKWPKPRDLGFVLGKSHRVDCYSSYELSIGIVGPPRSGKGINFIIPFILDAPGAVVTTSTKIDNLVLTMIARSKIGEISIMDPEGLVTSVTSVTGPLKRWSPLRGCESPSTSIRRASTLCAGVGEGVKDAGLWVKETEIVTQCLLHAGAIEGRTASDLLRWSLSASNSREAVKILAENPSATPGWSQALDGVISSDERHRDIVWSFVRTVWAPLLDPKIVTQLTPEPGAAFSPFDFINGRGTLYLLGTAGGSMVMENFITALIQDVIDVAYHEASKSSNGFLNPSLSLILDEISNYPLKSLGGVASSGGGNGITTVAVVQSLAQLRAQFGFEVAQGIWDSMNVKLYLPGSSSTGDLSDISRLIGDRDVTETSTTHHGGDGTAPSVSETTRQRPVLDPAMIRSIPMGHALLLLRNAKPIMLTLKPWTKRKRKEVRELRANKKAVEKVLRERRNDA